MVNSNDISFGIHVNEVICRSIINPSRIPDIDYTINPYTGCQHGCVYCYARFMTRYTRHRMEWGQFVDVKINGVEVLKKQLPRLPRGLVSLSTVTDPYQPLERKVEVTRNVLVELARHRFPVSILTKSDLVLRDIDVIKGFAREDCEVGFSITTLDENIRKSFEPNAPPVKDRLMALRELHRKGIRTWVFLAPVLPLLTQETLVDLLAEIKNFVDFLMVDKLNIKCGNWRTIAAVLKKNFPPIFSEWREVLFVRDEQKAYYQEVCGAIFEFCRNNRLDVRFIP